MSLVWKGTHERTVWNQVQRRWDILDHIQINVKKKKKFEARKKASLESLQPFWPPSKTRGYCTQFGEQCVCGGRQVTRFPSGFQSFLAEKRKLKKPHPSPQNNYSSTPNVLYSFKQKLPLWSSQGFLAFALFLMLLGLHRLKQVIKTLTTGYSIVFCNFLKLVTLPWATQSSCA